MYTVFGVGLDGPNSPFLGMDFEVPIAIVLPRKSATKFKAISAPSNVTEKCRRLFMLIRVFRAVVPHEVLTVLECRCTAAGCALEWFFMTSLVAALQGLALK